MKNFDKQLLAFLHNNDISFDYHEHVPVFTVEESEDIKHTIPGTHTKNLFLTDKKWGFYLVSIEAHKRFPIKAFRKWLGTKELSFASAEQLYEKLHLTPWSVSLFWLIYDLPPSVQVFIDKDLRDAHHVWRHPNRNDATIVLDHKMVEKFLATTAHHTHILACNEKIINIIN